MTTGILGVGFNTVNLDVNSGAEDKPKPFCVFIPIKYSSSVSKFKPEIVKFALTDQICMNFSQLLCPIKVLLPEFLPIEYSSEFGVPIIPDSLSCACHLSETLLRVIVKDSNKSKDKAQEG